MALPRLILTKIKGLLASVPEDETKPEFMNKKFEELLENDKYLDAEVEKRVMNDEFTEFTEAVSVSINKKLSSEIYAIDKTNFEDQLLMRPTQEVLDEEVSVLEKKINTKVNSSTFTAAKTALEAKDTEIQTTINNKISTSTYTTDKASIESSIAGKVKLNGESTNVNFIQSKVVQDGLVSVEESLSLNKQLKTVSIMPTNELNIFMKFSFEQTSNTRLIDFGVFAITVAGTTISIFDGGATSATLPHNFPISFLFKKRGLNAELILSDGETIKRTLKEDYVVSRLIYNTGVTKENIFVSYSNVYNRQLTPQEIQHNFSVLNNAPSISSIETSNKTSFLLSSDTDHVMTRTGHTEEERYTALLNRFGKKFTSAGEDITVANAIENQRALSTVIKGQTVKCIWADEEWITDKTSGWGINTVNINGIQVEPNKTYVMVVEIKENTKTTKFRVHNGTVGSVFSTIFEIPSNAIGFFKKALTTITDFSGKTSFIQSSFASNATVGTIVYRRSVLEIENIDLINSYIPFGLSSTQAVISNNGVKYSFYCLPEDKAQGKVIELPFAEDKVTLNEDGSCTWNKASYEGALSYADYTIGAGSVTDGFKSFMLDSTKIAAGGKIVCDKLETITPTEAYGATKRGIAISASANRIMISLRKDELISQDGDGLKNFLDTQIPNVKYNTSPTVTTIDKSLVPAILTQLQNEFKFGDAVKPSSVEITVATSDDISKSYSVTLLNGYTQTPSTATPIVNLANTGIVRLQMDLTAPSIGMNATIFTLPTELRPITSARIPVFVNGVSQLATIDKTTGNVNLASVPSASANVYIKTDYRRDI